MKLITGVTLLVAVAGASIAPELAAASASHGSKKVVLRRLNRAQYRSTVRDLLHIDVTVEDPTEAFAADDKKKGYYV